MAKKVKELKGTDAAYLAGFIDGEGTITLTNKRRGAYRYLAITISNTEKNLLDWIKKKVGAGIITKKRVVSRKHSQSYTYQIYSRQALDLLRQVKNYLRSYKKDRASFVLKYYVKLTPRNGKYTTEMLDKRERFVGDFFKITSGSN